MAVLAKLSPPRTAGVYPRERLFARLDECLRHAAVWICGPPGAGKTTLVASYLDARGLRSLWYQVDAGDSDPASFFYYLGLGARQAGLSKKVHLPLLTPEYMPDLPGFTRRYFRDLCQGLPQPFVLVLDNYQDAPEASVFDAVIRDALRELPQGTNAIVVSRSEPPAEHARLRASGTISQIGWEELRLDDHEATTIAASARRAELLPASSVSALVKRCGGWAAGLTLLLDQVHATGAIANAPRLREALFDYFAAELFDRLPPDAQHLLLRTALLPWVSTTMAEMLSVNSNAANLLEGLRRKHHFTERRAGAVPSYQYHALFKEFLAAKLRDVCTVEEQRQLAQESAQLLAQAGDPGAALPLFLQAQDSTSALQLVLGAAPHLAAQGQLQTLQEWIALLPSQNADDVPWIGYWRGVAQLASSPARAREQLERAFEGFVNVRDVLGQVMSVAEILSSYGGEFHDQQPTEAWVDKLNRLLEQRPVFPEPTVELSVLTSLLEALLMRSPRHAKVMLYAERVQSLLAEATDINARVSAATCLLHYFVALNQPAPSEQIVVYIRPVLTARELSPFARCVWLHNEAVFHQMTRRDAAKANAAIAAAVDDISRESAHPLLSIVCCRAAMIRLEESDTEQAAAFLSRGFPTPGGTRFDRGWHDGMQSWLALLEGRTQAAVAHATLLVDVHDKVGGSHSYFMALLYQANAFSAHGMFDCALECVARSRTANRTRQVVGDFTAGVIEADVHLKCGHENDAPASLRQAFALGSRERLFNTMQWLAPQMSRLCALALEHYIEPEYVRELIRVRHLAPPSPDTQVWPWPVKIHTLGRFEMLKDDAPLRVEGKTQRKPMALLKTLIALGGADVSETKLIEIVWPEGLHGDEQKTFDVTLHRLRKLLGHDKAILVTDRRVSFNREVVWVDLAALERQLGAGVPLERASAPDAAQLEHAAPLIMGLYQGNFLHDEPDAAWLLPVRNRLSGRFQRFVMRLGDHWEATAQWPRAAELFERAVELDPLAETFYSRLMICLREQGQRTEAIEVYRRLRRLLSLTLGVKPSEQTEAVYRGLMDG